MEKFLYFTDGTAGANATTEAICVPVSMIKSMEPVSASAMNIYFKELREEQGATQAVATARYSYVDLEITDGGFKDVCEAITGAINDVNNSGFIVIADTLNSKFIHPNITDATIKYSDTDTAA
tara:strand:- start:4628 stop:4996 length:369 start_codon:yes stop_codon:yes gene_type:complete